MKIDFEKIINIKNKQDLKNFPLNKPIHRSNYLFHYLIMLDNLAGLKLTKFPVYLENLDGLNGFHIAAKEDNIPILFHLIETYPEYIYNRNSLREAFTVYLPFEKFTMVISTFPQLNWSNLIEFGNKSKSVLKSIILNLGSTELSEFISIYNIKQEFKNQYLFCIIKSHMLKSEEKIKILDKFSNEELNIKNETGEGLILSVLDINDKFLFDYLISRNIDVDYYSFIEMDNPLRVGLYIDITNNQFYYSKIILKKVLEKNKDFYKDNNKYFDNLAHTAIYIRKSRNNTIINAIKYKNQVENADVEILKYCDSYVWNQKNIDKITPLELVIELNFETYSKILSDNKISVNPLIIKKIKDTKNSDKFKKWIDFLTLLPKYEEDISDINMDFYQYSHYTLFQSKFKDVGIFSIYLRDTYKELLVPNMKLYTLNNLTFDNTFPFSDNILSKEPIFPWIISYYSENEYYVHPYLNNLINAERREGIKSFGIVFISIIYNRILHANILIYDFKNMTVERFEPYGNSSLIDDTIDNVLEEELTWNTGLKYLRPGDYLPYAGFQTLSDDNNPLNKKAGDFGGFCLAWCLWYLETKLKNPLINSKTLVPKLIHKISNSDINFNEYIRNYSNKINEKRVEYLKKIGIDEKEISNVHLTINNDSKLTDILIKAYNSEM
jgi:hypothetical protein